MASAEQHILYLGLDVSVESDGETSPVVDADDMSVHVRNEGGRVRRALRQVRSLKTAVVPKVGRQLIEIQELEGEPTYSRATDPQRQAAAQQMLLISAQQAAEEVAAREMRLAQEALDASSVAEGIGVAEARRLGYPTPASAPSPQQFSAATSSATAYASALAVPAHSGAQFGSGPLSTSGRFDAFALNFKITAAESVGRAYGVFRLLLRRPEDPETPVSFVRFFNLPRLGPKPTRITVLHEGLPPGFTVDRYEVHIYENGRELVTNLSSNRVALSLDEIHQFFILQYMAEHPEGAAPVGIITALLGEDLREHVTGDQLNRSVEVEVDATGRATAVVLETAAARETDPRLASMLRDVRYLPALHAGQPVSGKARFVLSEFLPD